MKTFIIDLFFKKNLIFLQKNLRKFLNFIKFIFLMPIPLMPIIDSIRWRSRIPFDRDQPCNQRRCILIVLPALLEFQFVCLFFSHGFPFQLNPMGVVDKTIQNGVSECGITDAFMPALDRQLAGDDG